ncbi:MAG: hypothetical protein ACRD35_06960 [Candidatus Acidiferrales bacterium]
MAELFVLSSLVMGKNPRRLALVLVWGLWLAATTAAPQHQEPGLPFDDIVRHFAEKEQDYARAHALYRYQMSIKIEELGEESIVLGEFEQTSDVDYDERGQRRARARENPHTDLLHLSVQRVDLQDLEFIPLFILAPSEIPDYEIRYVTKERLDEVDTYVFRLTPRGVVRYPDRRFEGVVWVDAERLDVVRALGRSLPARGGGAFGGYFQRLEIFREPVDKFMFPTFIRAEDTLAAREQTVRLRLTIRFTKHERVAQPANPAP